MFKYIFILLVSCSESIFKKKTTASSSSTGTLSLNCLNAADSNDVANATEWDSFLSESNSYLIFTAQQLLSLSAQPTLINKHIELCADIDFKNLYDAGHSYFMLPGLDQNSSFDGNNFKLSNFTFISTLMEHPDLVSVALFRGAPAYDPAVGNYFLPGLNRGTIKNLVLDNILIQAQSDYIAGISVFHQMNPITNVRILSGTLENTRDTSPDGGMISGIVVFIDTTSVLSPDNILTDNFIFENNSTTNIILKYTNNGLIERDFYTGGLIAYLLQGSTSNTDSISVILRNNFANFTTFGNSLANGLVSLIGTDLCNAGPTEKCMDVVFENTYSKAFHNVISVEIDPKVNYYGGMIGTVNNNAHVDIILNNVFSEMNFSVSQNAGNLTPLFDYTTHYLNVPALPPILLNSFGVTINSGLIATSTPLVPAITTNYLTHPLQVESYFYDNINNLPVSIWDTNIWDFSGSDLPVLKP